MGPNYRHRQVGTRTDRQTDRQTGRQADRQTGRQAGRQALGLVRKSVHGRRIIGNTANRRFGAFAKAFAKAFLVSINCLTPKQADRW